MKKKPMSLQVNPHYDIIKSIIDTPLGLSIGVNSGFLVLQ
jgi:hypothetical protein